MTPSELLCVRLLGGHATTVVVAGAGQQAVLKAVLAVPHCTRAYHVEPDHAVYMAQAERYMGAGPEHDLRVLCIHGAAGERCCELAVQLEAPALWWLGPDEVPVQGATLGAVAAIAMARERGHMVLLSKARLAAEATTLAHLAAVARGWVVREVDGAVLARRAVQ